MAQDPKAKLEELFEYNSCFNVKLIEAIVPRVNEFPKRVEEVINHILNSHIFWNNRITGKPDIDRWQIRPVDSLLKVNEQSHVITQEILNNRGLDEVVAFKNSKGGTSTSTINQIYTHLVNHGTYHRGQLALLFRQSGVMEPIQTDLIFWQIWINTN